MSFGTQHLYKTYRNESVLRDVTFSVPRQSISVILGSSGSGKTTLLRCLSLLDTPNQGVLFNGATTTTLPATSAERRQWASHIGMVFQQFHLWAHLTVLQNINLAPIKVLGLSPAEAKARAQTLLQQMGLWEKRHAYPSQLSGGQQQRVAIARALATSPDILLFDEPTSALDPENVKSIATTMQMLAHAGKTLIIATHDLYFARRVATHVIFLDHGTVQEAGDPAQLFQHPKNPKLQQFLACFNEEPL